ncbi:hypothetical protein RBS60_11315 [Sinomonas sp. ASV486]|uniref:hypothetical protein n=1 Tax=Sinomonas sp. ASV486 TaxID=3051170 RepID=UPI0027DD15E2|nr:hypothetical protein [Sinomonas sp. ASV486]MDQ4490783.1 hypothetical protein [Sinomonas sp. ASV486]
MTPQTEERILIEAHTRGDLETKLEQSLSTLIEQARGRGDRGIAVIRRSPQHYIVELDARVAYGTILERCEWQA